MSAKWLWVRIPLLLHKLIQNVIKDQQKDYVCVIQLADLKQGTIVARPILPTKPFILHVKSYVKDNLYFSLKCSRDNYKDRLLATFDVVS